MFIDKVLNRIDRLDRKELEQYFRELGDRHRMLTRSVDAIPSGMVVFDAHTRVLLMNQTARNILGIPDSASKKWVLQSLVADEKWREMISASLRDGSSFLHREVEVFAPRPLVLEVSLVPLADKTGLAQNILVFTDVTHFRDSDRNARKREKIESIMTLAQAIAHEIGNPLNSIGIQLKLFQKEAAQLSGKNKERIDRTVRILLDETSRLDRIIRQFLSLSRPPAVRFRKVNINEILRNVIEFLAPELRAAKIVYALELSKEVSAFLADPDLLYRAFLNLTKNAVEAMPKGGRLIIRSVRNGKLAVVTFQDEGVGIAKKDHERIFDLYYTTKSSGSGLGLSIVEQIIEEHGGRIEIESDTGKGAKFRITLPIRQHRLELSDYAGRTAL